MPVQRLLHFLGWPVTAGLLIAVLLLLLFPQLRPKAPAQPVSNSSLAASSSYGPVSYSAAVDRAAPAVVNIYTTKIVNRRYRYTDNPLYRHLYNNANAPQQVRMQSTLGSGVIVSSDGHILTNNHVISGADEIIILLHDGRETGATLVGTDPENDIAVLKIDLDNLTAISQGDPLKARVGDIVLAIGNPFGVGQSVSQGIISATGRYGLRTNSYENFIQTDAAINPGNSGGALVDAHGNLLGISTAVLDETDTSAGISFAIPADSAMKSLEQIVANGSVVRGWLGLDANQLNAKDAKRYGTAGIIVMAVIEGSPADRANLKPGDIITHINNRSVADARQGMFLVAEITPGSEVNIKVLRQGQILELVAIAGVRPSARTRT